MTRFVDVPLDPMIPSWPCDSAPRFSTTITEASSGAERRNRNWAHPLRTFHLPEAIREQDTFNALYEHWLITGGPEATFPWRDPLDFASIALDEPNVEPAWTGEDQALGTGDGLTRDYQIRKTYERGGYTYQRDIHLPSADPDEFEIRMNGKLPSDGTLTSGPYTVTISRPGGVATFTPAPANGLTLTWGGLFDCEVRFEGDDTVAGIIQSYRVAGFANIDLKEVRPC